ncbi:MAG TPA: hypothetical protein PKI77_14100, partial [Mycobacterium sp.]|nr:hypothetical protein [Mycobacterium sp.]
MRAYLTAGVTAGATSIAMAGIGALSLLDNQTPASVSYEVRLASEDCVIGAADCATGGGGTVVAAAAVSAADANGTSRPMIGPGGWLFGDGLNAAQNCSGSACNGGDGGLFGGDGGDGANGGKGTRYPNTRMGV